MDIKLTLEACRKNTGMTLMDAADNVGVSYQTLSKYENDSGNIPMELFSKLSALYKIPKEYIFLGNKNDFFQEFKNKPLV